MYLIPIIGIKIITGNSIPETVIDHLVIHTLIIKIVTIREPTGIALCETIGSLSLKV